MDCFFLGYYYHYLYIFAHQVFIEAINNTVTNVIAGFTITLIVTRFVEKLTLKRNSIGALRIIKGEIFLNQHILNSILKDLIEEFEKIQGRTVTNNPTLPQNVWDGAAEVLEDQSKRLAYEAFNSSYSGIGNLSNTTLLEDLINLYTVIY